MSPGPRVLVVEDNLDLVDLLREALQYLGADVAVATTAAEGLEQYRLTRPHLALVDLRLAGGSGLELARAIRAEGTSSPLLVAVTGLSGQVIEQQAFAAGFDRVLIKPFDLTHVQSLFDEALARA